LLLM
ncbi:periplasmic binding family protein, partial [Vibrio parahaemolyticus V-223/04]